MTRGSAPPPLYINPGTTGELHDIYTVSSMPLAQCAQYGHAEKTRFGTLSKFMVTRSSEVSSQQSLLGIVAAAAFFPWGLLCLMGSRVVYCERCGLVLRGPRACKMTRKEHRHKHH